MTTATSRRSAGRARPAYPAVIAISTAVRGRARLRVPDLRGRPVAVRVLVARLGGHTAVREVRASELTGSVLVHFDPLRLDVTRLMGLLAREAAHARSARNGAVPKRVAMSEALAWHSQPKDAVLARLDTSEKGLTTAEAERRQLAHGANLLPTHRPKSAVEIVRGHLSSTPVLLLGGAAALALVTGAVVDAVVILAVIGANAAVGYATESRVERILTTLQNAALPQAVVRRDGGDESVVPAASLAAGDVIVLRPGYDVPADARLLRADGLAVDESLLTGESVPVAKSAEAMCPVEAPVADRRTMVHAGTAVAEGWGLACVTGVGIDSELGRIRMLVAETTTPPTPLERQLDRLGRGLVAVSLGACAAALGFGLLRGIPALEMLRSAVSLAVAAVPEGLPAVATTTLALGMQRMMRHGVLVRRLSAVESLGATTVICADKTGTLTENRMAVHAWYVEGREIRQTEAVLTADRDPTLARALTVAALCNEAELVNGDDEVRGSSTEGALLGAARGAGLDYRALRDAYPLVASRPRLNGDTWMATVHARDGWRLTAVKGACDAVLPRCTRVMSGGEVRPLDDHARRDIVALEAGVAARGLRVLALALKETAPNGDPTWDDLVWIGLVALTDPVRPGVREAIAACHRAGIRTVMLTGDHAQTALAIARELGLGTRVVESSELVHADAQRLAQLAAEVDVFARVSPSHKYQIVRALQAAGHVVAMTGDGINDAAALRAADIGVAMGARGTDLARDVADVVLLDDDFDALVRAVAQGRSIHANVGRSLRFLLSTNFSEILATLGALAFSVPRPLSAIQLLWINLLSDVAPALALATEPADQTVMERPPRDPRAPIVPRSALGELAGEAAMLSAAALGAQAVGIGRHGPGVQATSLAFSTLTTAQLLHTLRYRATVAEGAPRSSLVPVVAASLGAQALALLSPPLRRVLGLAPPARADWLVVAAGALAPAAVSELRRRAAAVP